MVAELYGLDLEENELHIDTKDSPSFPSGHATQGTLIANYLANKHPNHSIQIYFKKGLIIMANSIKEQQDILTKLNIHVLNPMQKEAISIIESTTNTILLSPTGTGKTLAFLLPIIKTLDPNSKEVQALIIVPSRELAQQIEQVARKMGSGFKVNAVYGGRSGSLDKIDLSMYRLF